MRLFDAKQLTSELADRNARLKNEISSLSSLDMDSTGRSAWIDHFVSKYAIDPLEVFEDHRELEVEEKQVEIFNEWSRFGYGEPKYLKVLGILAFCRVPYTGDQALLSCMPSRHIMTVFEAKLDGRPSGDKPGYLVLSHEWKQQGTGANEIQKYFESQIKSICTEISYCNADVQRHNEGLRASIELLIDRRIEQLDGMAKIRKELGLPLNRVKDAPQAKPLLLKRKKVMFDRPKPDGSRKDSYSIPDSDYQNIVEIIDSACAVMEGAPDSYKLLGEEQLRDSIRSSLSTHYDNVTGETFRNKGKTDIYIPFRDHAAFISECKIWHGRKKFEDAIDQLFSYTTWRDTKVSVVIFNREVKSFETVLNGIDGSLSDRSLQVSRTKHSRWSCLIRNDADGRLMHVTVQAFNLFVEDE